MKIFSPLAIAAVFDCLKGSRAVHEHSALNIEIGFDADRDALKMLGFRTRLEVPDVAVFLERGEHRIELIAKNVKAHEAWIVKTQAEFRRLYQRFDDSMEFELNPKQIVLPHLLATMFVHHKTGGVIQIVWRKKQIYRNLFSKKNRR